MDDFEQPNSNKLNVTVAKIFTMRERRLTTQALAPLGREGAWTTWLSLELENGMEAAAAPVVASRVLFQPKGAVEGSFLTFAATFLVLPGGGS